MSLHFQTADRSKLRLVGDDLKFQKFQKLQNSLWRFIYFCVLQVHNEANFSGTCPGNTAGINTHIHMYANSFKIHVLNVLIHFNRDNRTSETIAESAEFNGLL